MAYSTIEKKRCKCGTEDNPCNLWPTSGYDGFNWSHAPEEVVKKQAEKKSNQIKKSNARKSASFKLRSDSRPKDELTGETVKQMWFNERRKEMTGKCTCGCGLSSSAFSDDNFRSSICHILPQKNFSSVQFHPLNWIELNYSEGHHYNFDFMGSDRWDKLACWPEIVRRFKIIYPLTFPNERKHVPRILRQFICEAPDTPVEQAISTKQPV